MPEVTVGSMSGYLAVPAGPPPGPWPSVVVIHESWGLNADILAHADRLAAQGYLALAPDLYRGRSFVRCLRGVFQQEAAEDSWHRILAFFGEHLQS